MSRKNALVKYDTYENSPEELAAIAVNEAKLTALYDQMYAGLAKQALDNTAWLAGIADNYRKMVPSATEELQRIYQSYAYRAVMMITGGRQ